SPAAPDLHRRLRLHGLGVQRAARRHDPFGASDQPSGHDPRAQLGSTTEEQERRMSILRIAERFRREESGIAMIVAVVLLAVMGTLMALVMTISLHTNFSTGHGRSAVQAL